MTLNELKDNFVFKAKIDLGEIKEELKGEFIVLREPSLGEMQKARGQDDGEIMNLLLTIFPSCIVESSITTSKGEPASGQAIANMLTDAGTDLGILIRKWIERCPFTSLQENKEK